MIYKTQSNQKIYVLGAGAVGCYFGGMLARAHHDVTFIARPERATALNESGLQMDCKAFHETIAVKASSDLAILSDADLVLLSVKSLDTERTLAEIKSILPSKAVILSLQNGVANIDIATKIIVNPVYAAVVYVAARMIDQRTMKHHGRGELLIGDPSNTVPQGDQGLLDICKLFEGAKVPCSIAPQIKRDMWLKFLVNCSFNAISGIGQIAYGEMVKSPGIVKLIEEITKEFLAIAELEDVNITMSEALAANASIASTMATQVSSTAQDLARGKMTEIDFLNGFIVELGKRHGITTPYNESVHVLVKMMESPIK
ncbi:2-dehydropantoate 2-reductase [Polynucleobacter sp. AP-Sanab-80-C2]|uniref:ketopantoate reductase family protein n=1 Tax=Polynucleobacter sp. AP-Sanab-80-C2 TaxID=3108274 RepID=UPI002B227A69|nr:2-dehydropantoate 2-reductase [Polynucleobacter sp. AP-Sanab-80-C2]MEA9600149.1 2-dehydropantoate 2-reductase [Polynucleobacter sp. AP-Sanab-80-C2]